MVINNRVALCNIANQIFGSHFDNLFLIRLVVQRGYIFADPLFTQALARDTGTIIQLSSILLVTMSCPTDRCVFLLCIPDFNGAG